MHKNSLDTLDIKLTKVSINPEKEYDCLKQEVLKRQEFQHTVLSIKLTIVAAFLGFGLNNDNNLLILGIPPFVLLFSVIWKHNTYYRTKILCFIEKKFETTGSLSWETYNHRLGKEIKISELFLSFGLIGMYLIFPIIAFFIGIVQSKGSLIENVLLIIDGASIVLIGLICFLFNSMRIRKMLYKQLHALEANKIS